MGLGSVLHTALSGMAAAESLLAAVSNNLANAQTAGYKQSRPVFATQSPQTSSRGAAAGGGSAGSNPVQTGRGVRVVAGSTDFSQGSLVLNSNPLSLAVNGDGFFVVEGSDGQRLYTRDGQFGVNAAGEVVTSDGLRVLGYSVNENFEIDSSQLGPVRIPTTLQVETDDGGTAHMTGFSISQDGQIEGRFSDGSIRELGQIATATFANPSGLEQQGGTRFAEGPNSGLAVIGSPGSDGRGSVLSGAVELSNTDIGLNQLDMMSASTQFRVNLQVVSATDQLLDELVDLRRID
ncbi:MAG: flagellar hook basal-body protein [Pirellulales bacterium]|nr:flagellar hook basal-body protein [Pirellulales bacterium]